MGREAACTARIGGKAVTGKALLETKELLFRGGGAPVRIPFTAIQAVEAAGGDLVVRHGGGEARFALGAAEAAKWMERIKNPPGRLDKLGVKAGARVAVVGPIEPAFVAEARGRAAAVTEGGQPGGGEDLVFFAVEGKADLRRLRALAAAMQPAGALWVVRRKGAGAAVTEAESMAAGKAAGLVDTKVVAFSETHTAERYVIPVAARAVRPARRSRSARPR
jgi:hypothetical protein